ncbi:hypothetical protein HAZT_HAZT009151 [Hyalella azteca]|uniref:Neutral ceramidase n=1 Tax=Hyalella azteca TaxID=294128 RepID=A0A6A0GRX0_HYAAZ|nr:hypothetical protein HAZT_HAZT009151 [Hyalella azteca]
MICKVLLSLLVLGAARAADPATGIYNIGVGRYDITGPAAGVNMMGYVNPAPINDGIHIRLFARAFIIDDDTNRFVFVNTDLGMATQLVKMTAKNVIISGTHTHSGPAGYIQYLLYQVPSLGFIDQAYESIVYGIVESIIQAHNSITTGRLYYSSGELLNANINRSPSAYLNNPEEERAKYQYDTDKTMTLLKFVAEDGTDLGMVNWFAVHPTSMNKTNTLVSGDNKGYAEQLFEKAMDPGSLAGKGKFVGAFAQSNCGDVSPNTDGPKCQDTGLACDILTSTCGGRVKLCYAAGPGKDMEESTEIFGTRQFEKAVELYNDPNAVQVIGPVQIIGQQLDMSNYTVTLANGTATQTCRPALGFSFAAGATDGPGVFDFTQGMTEDNPFWTKIVNFVVETDPEQIVCHHPKPILLETGNYHRPYEWTSDIVETQVARVGQFVIAAVPGEFTTMSGRRMRDQLSSVFAEEGVPGIVPVIAGLSNVYTHYITTFEEYAIQRYEGASTIFGPHTLEAYMQHYTMLARAMLRGKAIPPGPAPPNLLKDQISLVRENVYDSTPFDYAFGDVLAQPYPVVYPGETVIVKFVSAHPRNDPLLGGSFLTVERQADDGSWEVIATDADWETKYSWQQTSKLLGTSVATVKWDVPEDTTNGTFRISHTGHAKFLEGTIQSFLGVTEPFFV